MDTKIDACGFFYLVLNFSTVKTFRPPLLQTPSWLRTQVKRRCLLSDVVFKGNLVRWSRCHKPEDHRRSFEGLNDYLFWRVKVADSMFSRLHSYPAANHSIMGKDGRIKLLARTNDTLCKNLARSEFKLGGGRSRFVRLFKALKSFAAW